MHFLDPEHFIDEFVVPIAETLRGYENFMGLDTEHVYEGNGFYAPITDPKYRSMMRQ